MKERKIDKDKCGIVLWLICTLCFVLLAFCIISMPVKAAENNYTYYFTVTRYGGSVKYDCVVSSSNPIVVVNNMSGGSDVSDHQYEFMKGTNFVFYTLDSTGTNLTTVTPTILRTYSYTDGEWILTNDYESAGTVKTLTYNSYAYGSYGYGCGYFDFNNSGLEILKVNIGDRFYDVRNGVQGIYAESHNIEDNIMSYLLNGTFIDVPSHRPYVFSRYSSADKLTPSFAYNNYGTSFATNGSFSVLNAQIDENGILSFDDFVVDESNVKSKGVIAYFCDPTGYYSTYWTYDKILTSSSTYQLNLGGVKLATLVDGVVEYKNYSCIALQPYYISNDGVFYSGERTTLSLDSTAAYYTREGMKVLEEIRGSNDSDKGVLPNDGDIEIKESGIYDKNCYFEDFEYWSLGDTNRYFCVSWSDVNTSREYISSSVMIYVANENVGGYYLYNDDDFFFSSGSAKLDQISILSFLMNENNHNGLDESVGGTDIRFVPVYYTADATYYGKVIDLHFRDGEFYITQLEGSYIDGAYDTTDLTPSDYYEDNSVIGGFVGDILNPAENETYDIDLLTLDFFSLIKGLISACGQFPALVNNVFSFLPDVYTSMLVVSLGLVVLMRILGR